MADGYTVYRTKGGFEFELPAGVDPRAPDVKAWVQGEERKARQSSPDFKAKEATQRSEDEALYDPTKGMSALDKTRANLGAGLSNVWEGLKQITPGVKGATDEQVVEKRNRDKHLAESTQLGVGADWMPSAGTVLQVAGEAAPALAIPAGAAAGAAGKVLPKALQWAVATPVRAGFTSGALSGALMPTTSDESRLANTAAGGIGGAALPLAVKGYQHVRKMLPSNAGSRAGKMLLDDLGPDARDAMAAVRTHYPQGAENIPLSTAAVTQHPKLGMAERADRAARTAEWRGFDETQGQRVWENVERATANADNLPAARAARSQGWTEREAAALANMKPRNWANEKAAFEARIEQALRSPAGQNQMRGPLQEIQRQMAELGDEFSMQHLAALRSRMASGIRGTPNDPIASAPKSDPFFMSLRDEMDRILNKSTGGKWQRVVQGYADESAPVTAAKASEEVRGKFVSPQGVSLTGEIAGVPKVTEHKLANALASKGESRFGDSLAPESRGRLTATLEALRAQNYPANLKATGTLGGSNTVMDAINIVRGQAGNAGIIERAGRAVLSWAQEKGDKRLAMEITEALQNPDRFVALLEQAQRAGKVSPAQQMIAQAIAASAGAGTASAVSQLQQ